MVAASRKIAAFALLAASAGFAALQTTVPPKTSEPAIAAMPIASPPTRSNTYRKVHRISPKIAKRKWEPLPTVRPIPPIMKEEKRRPVKQARPRAKQLPSCAVIRARRQAMTLPEQLAAYSRATPEEIAHGRRCLGL